MDYNKIYILLKREWYETKQTILWLSIFTLFFCVVTVLQLTSVRIHGDIITSYTIIGFLFASIAFREFKSSIDTRYYLLIPASLTEKVVSKFIFYIIGWLLLFIISILCAMALVICFAIMFNMPIFNMFSIMFILSRAILSSLIITIVYQSLAIFASCYLKRLVLIKLSIIYLLVILPISSLVKYEIIVLTNYLAMINSSYIISFTIIKIIIQILAIGLLWVLIWLRVRETEAL